MKFISNAARDGLIELELNSIWYETSLTIAAKALKEGIKTEYHTFRHMPREVERDLARFGLDRKKMKNERVFKLIDRYTVQTGLDVPEKRVANVSTDYANRPHAAGNSIQNGTR